MNINQATHIVKVLKCANESVFDCPPDVLDDLMDIKTKCADNIHNHMGPGAAFREACISWVMEYVNNNQ